MPAIDKTLVAASFSKAAKTYDDMASLQRRVGHRLLARAGDYLLSGTVLDLGCGTGYFSEEIATMPGVQQVLAVDIAEGMLSVAKQNRKSNKIKWLGADAEKLPLADNSVNCIFTSLAIQWCDNIDALAAELERVLRPGGWFLFATTGPDTLYELRQAWAAVDSHVHVNPFIPHYKLQAALATGFSQENFAEEQMQMKYKDLPGLMRELKGIGAHNLNPGRPEGLLGKQRFAALLQAYEMFRQGDGYLPASYQIYFGLYRRLGHI